MSCVDCFENSYSSIDSSQCLGCSALIGDCLECEFQAPFEQAKCAKCIDGKVISDDKYSCVNESHLVLIVGIVVGVLVVIGAGGTFLSI